jgi:hypothetical protein
MGRGLSKAEAPEVEDDRREVIEQDERKKSV